MTRFTLALLAVAALSTLSFLSYGEEPLFYSGALVRSRAADGTTETVREVRVTAKKYHYEPAEIVVAQGEKVRLLVTSADVRHGLKISDFNVSDSNIVRGKDTVLEFVADKPGTHTIKCSHLCGFGHLGMSGKLLVKKL